MCDGHGNCSSHGHGGGVAAIKLLRYQIGRQGYAISYALGHSPSFACTTGLDETFGHPELVVSGLDYERSTEVLTHLATLVKEGRSFEPGEISIEVPGQSTVCFVRVPGRVAVTHLQETVSYYGERPFSALQVLWPDEEGRFPTDEACSAAVKRLQVVLSQAG